MMEEQELQLDNLPGTPTSDVTSSPMNAMNGAVSTDSNDDDDVAATATTDEQEKERKKKKKEKKEKRDKKERKSSSGSGSGSGSRRSSSGDGDRRSSRSSGDGERRRSSRRHHNESPPPAVTMASSSSSTRLAASTIGDHQQPSPSAVCRTRRHSPVVKTSSSASHELSVGREAHIVLPNMTNSMKPAPATTGKIRTSSSNIGRLPRPMKLDTENGDDDNSDLQVQRARSDSMVEETRNSSNEYLSNPPPLRIDAWTEPPGNSFSVRGPNYLQDSKKIASAPAAFRLLTVDMVKCEDPKKPIMTGLCAHPNERYQRAVARENATGVKELPPFVFCINLVIPTSSILYHVVFYFGIDNIDLINDRATTPFGKLANQFFFSNRATDAFRNATFKLIPRIVEGNFIVRKAVGAKPAILGKKIKQTYIRTDRYMELIVDIASEPVAAKIVNLTIGYAKTLSVDMAFVLEGNHPAVLPEQVLGAARLNHIDFKKRDAQRRIAVPK